MSASEMENIWLVATVAEIQVFLIIYLSINQFGFQFLYFIISDGFCNVELKKKYWERKNGQMYEHVNDDIGIDSYQTLECMNATIFFM